jgi:hypothetical protein
MKLVRRLLPASAGPIHGSRHVMLERPVKNLGRRQAFMPVNRDAFGANAQ